MIYLLGIVGVFLGVRHKMPQRYWLALLTGGVVNVLAGALFYAGGTLKDPSGDGLITHWLRVVSNDGPLVVLALPIAYLFIGVSIWLPHRVYKAEKAKRAAEAPVAVPK